MIFSIFSAAAFFLGLGTALPATRTIESVQIEHAGQAIIAEYSTIENGTVPPGAQRVAMGNILLKAPCTDTPAIIEEITLYRRGLGASADIASVYGMAGNTRISRGQSIHDSNGEVTIRTGALRIDACEELTIAIVADFSQNAAPTGEHRFELRSAEDIRASSPVVLLPSSSASADAIQTAGNPQGAISVSYPSLTETVRFGNNRRVARMLLSADSLSDHTIEAITLTNQGSASDSDLELIYLESSRGVRLTDIAPAMNGDVIRLTFSPPLLLDSGSEQLLSVRANVRGGRSKTIRLEVEEPSDIRTMPTRNRR